MLGRNPDQNGHGVRGEGGRYGGQFKGTSAQLHLVPTATAGRPILGLHDKGEIVLDSTGALFVCVVAGTPGTWVRVATQAA